MILNKKTPDVYIEEESSGARPIDAVGTSTAGFIGKAPVSNPDFLKKAERVNNWTEFCNKRGLRVL
jgi:phage tail sheath protein FI